MSAYPPDMQRRYELFSRKCSRCHSLDRPLHAHVGANGWLEYVQRMSRHPGAGITFAEQREIALFLAYYSRQNVEKSR